MSFFYHLKNGRKVEQILPGGGLVLVGGGGSGERACKDECYANIVCTCM
jgi:hypothetical protein